MREGGILQDSETLVSFPKTKPLKQYPSSMNPDTEREQASGLSSEVIQYCLTGHLKRFKQDSNNLTGLVGLLLLLLAWFIWVETCDKNQITVEINLYFLIELNVLKYMHKFVTNLVFFPFFLKTKEERKQKKGRMGKERKKESLSPLFVWDWVGNGHSILEPLHIYPSCSFRLSNLLVLFI